MPLPLTVSCFSKFQIGFYLSGTGSPGWSRKKGRSTGVCVCVSLQYYHYVLISWLLCCAEVYGVDLVQPGCNFPRNFTGTWYTTAEFDSDVIINNTHIYLKTKIDEYTYQESIFTCQQQRDSRYLVTAVTVGRWSAMSSSCLLTLVSHPCVTYLVSLGTAATIYGRQKFQIT